jgi:phosphocarrier protein
MVERSVQVTNRNGIHARPAAEIVKVAARYKSQITLIRDDLEVSSRALWV